MYGSQNGDRHFEEEKIVEHVNEVSEYLTERLEELVQHVDGVLERKGTGLMQGIVLKATGRAGK